MKTNEYASITLKKIIFISLIVIFFLGISVLAGNVRLNSVKIVFSNDHEITILTSKTKVLEILEENHIILSSDETVKPSIDEDITDNKTIKISLIGEEPVAEASNIVATVDENKLEDIKQKYVNITEQIITVTEAIPFETITKDVSSGDGNTASKVVQSGKNGIKEITYKVKYQDEVEIAREELESKIIKEPVNKIVEISKSTVVTSRSDSRVTAISSTSGTSGKYKVTAYCACLICCGKTNGITASGKKATANHTIATPKTFAFGTKLLINGKEYVVEDRGGAIQGNRIDIYMNTHSEALKWGVKYLDVQVL